MKAEESNMDPRLRFSNRVENYLKYRPGYPAGLIDTLRQKCGIDSTALIADVGSGTGLFARIFLNIGCRVIGIEPNLEMRQAGDRLLADFPNFSSREGSAEATGLENRCVDVVSAGQAFHWFDRGLARQEFLRILKPQGWVVVAWNYRRIDLTPFLRDYEGLIQQYGTDYNKVNHANVENDPEVIQGFFGGLYEEAHFDNLQRFDFEGVKGRLLSSSYVPDADQPDSLAMLAELRRIFDLYQSEGTVDIEYDTHMMWGHLSGSK
jgi:SAM-dependent methyltransferase